MFHEPLIIISQGVNFTKVVVCYYLMIVYVFVCQETQQNT